MNDAKMPGAVPKFGYKITVMPSNFSDIKLVPVAYKIDETGIKITIPSDLLINSNVVVNLKSAVNDDDLNLFGEVMASGPSDVHKGQFESQIRFLFMSENRKKILKKFIDMAPLEMDTVTAEFSIDGWQYYGLKPRKDLKDGSPMGMALFVAAIVSVFAAIVAFFLVVFRYVDSIRMF